MRFTANSLTVSGNVTAARFFGDASGLTGVVAPSSNLQQITAFGNITTHTITFANVVSSMNILGSVMTSNTLNFIGTGDRVFVGKTTPGFQGSQSVAINMGDSINQAQLCVSLGFAAGLDQQSQSVSVGAFAGSSGQKDSSVAIGAYAAQFAQNTNSVAIGLNAGRDAQSIYAIAIGSDAGVLNQKPYCVAIGRQAGNSGQNNFAVAIGFSAGNNRQDSSAVAVGIQAGETNQGIGAIAFGGKAANNTQGPNAVAIGYQAANQLQGSNAVAIGFQAGQFNQGVNSIAIGALAANQSPLPANTICINSTGLTFNPTTPNAFYVKPIRNIGATVSNVLMYSASSGEVYYGNKTFVIPHPKKDDAYLVHACLEGPEAGVYYRGEGDITEDFATITLPDYVPSLIMDRGTVQITPIFNGKIRTLNATKYDRATNSFQVHGEKGPFDWCFTAKRLDVEVEPKRDTVDFHANGPYTYLTKKK